MAFHLFYGSLKSGCAINSEPWTYSQIQNGINCLSFQDVSKNLCINPLVSGYCVLKCVPKMMSRKCRFRKGPVDSSWERPGAERAQAFGARARVRAPPPLAARLLPHRPLGLCFLPSLPQPFWFHFCLVQSRGTWLASF